MSEILIDGERAYPCYDVRVVFHTPRTEKHGPSFNGPNWQVDGRPDLLRDVSSTSIMHREPLTDEKTAEIVAKIAAQYIEKHPGAVEVSHTVERTHHETWCLQWFCHFTWPDGRTDEELLASFERYVSRHQHYQGLDFTRRNEDGSYRICLMGAEDRWRWRGENDDRDNPVCRCEGCTKHGIVRIIH